MFEGKFVNLVDLANPPQPPLATRTKTALWMSLIPRHGALSLNHRPRPCVARHPKTSPDAQGQPRAHLITMMVLHSDDYGVPTAPEQQTGRTLRPLQEVTCILGFYPVSAMLDQQAR